MSKHTATLTDNESVFLATVGKRCGIDMYEITVCVYDGGGNGFGGGTVTLQASPDNGTTKVTLRDIAGTIVSITQDDIYNIRLGYANKNGEELQIYATMAGATAPTVNVAAYDNMA